MKHPGHLFLEERVLQPQGEWTLRNEAWVFLRVASGEASWVDDCSSFLLAPGEVLLVTPARRGTLRASQLSVLTTVYFRFRPDLLGGFLTVHERSRAERAVGVRGLSRVFDASHNVAREFKAICGLSPDLDGPITAPLTEARATLEKWVEARQQISKANSDWQADKETIQQTILLFERELKSVAEQRAKVSTNAVQVDKERLEAEALQKTSKEGLDRAREFVTGFEAEADPAKTKMTVAERVQVVIGILNELDKFNNGVSIHSEKRKNDKGEELSVETVFF